MAAKLNGNTMNLYQNPERKSLEEVKLMVMKRGNLQTVPALSEVWMEKITFLEYEAPKIFTADGNEIFGARGHWLELAQTITADLKWLLRLPFFQFWSNVVYNPTIGDCLVSCLQEFPTCHNRQSFPRDSHMHSTLEELCYRVFLVLARLVTSKESKEAFMTHKVHGDFLYDKYLLTVPMMLDICQLYGRDNQGLVQKMITTAMKLQPLYSDDFYSAANFFVEVLRTVNERFEDRTLPSASGPVPLADRGSNAILTIQNLEDLIIHVLDVSSNISIFLVCFPPASDFLNNENFINEIVHLYGNTIPEMYRRLAPLEHDEETFEMYMELKHRLDVSRVELLRIFRNVTFHNIEEILAAPNPSEVPGAAAKVERFIDYLDKAVSEREFMIDYNRHYPIEIDLDLVSKIGEDLYPLCANISPNLEKSPRNETDKKNAEIGNDKNAHQNLENDRQLISKEKPKELNLNPEICSDPVKYSFIKKSVAAELEHDQNKKPQTKTRNNVSNPAPIAGSSREPAAILNDDPRNDATNGIARKTPEELASLISGVKDILCDLGEGFIEKCLVHYNYDVAAVINAVFEDSLPESLKAVDRSLPYIPPDPEEAAAAIDRILGSERLNVFDNDEFDVMTRDVIDKDRVHKGKKKDKYKNFGQLINDKSHMRETSNIYQKYSMIQDEYDDEYDDTYDSHDVGPNGLDEPLEMDRRAFTTPRILRCGEKREVEDDDEDQEEGEAEEAPSRGQNDRCNFVQDPAEMRARAEQRRLSKRGGGAAGGSRGARTDVIGKPKGQGNDKNVLINRDRKNTNKATRGNHNRRSGADFKRRQGMMP